MRKIFALVATLLFINCGYSQIRIGLKAGGNLANMDDFDKTKMKLGLSAGPVLQIHLGQTLFAQTELLYSIKGAKAEQTQTGSDVSLNLNYITLPILFAYRASPNFALKLGPELGYLLSAKSSVEGGNTTDLSKYYEDFDFGADLGLAYQFKKLTIDLRYNYGLLDLLNISQTGPNGTPTGDDKTGSNRVLHFSLCYFIK
jgi:hypothetical protein